MKVELSFDTYRLTVKGTPNFGLMNKDFLLLDIKCRQDVKELAFTIDRDQALQQSVE